MAEVLYVLLYIKVGDGSMMTTKAEVLNYIREVTDTFDFENSKVASATAVSQTLSISRSLASQYLNELYRESLLIKISARPVLFLDKEVLKYTYGIPLEKDEYLGAHQLQKELQNNQRHRGLYEMIGSRASLRHVVEQLYASVTYPPSGLPLLLIGQRGVGKESLVKAVYRDSIKQRIISEHKEYIHIDLSDEKTFKDEYEKIKEPIGLLYVSNIELLSKHDLDFMMTLFEKQNYIIILSAEDNQNVSDELVKSIPLHAKICNLEDRYEEERLEFVIRFLKEESFNLKQTLRISKQTIKYIANLEFENQLEDLQRFVKMVCAKANSDFNNYETIDIHMYHLKGLIDEPFNETIEIDEMLLVSEISMNDPKVIDHYKRIMLHMNDYTHYLGLYVDYVMNHMMYDYEHSADIKKSLEELFQKHTLLREEEFFRNNIELISLTLYSLKRNYLKIHQWETNHNQLLNNIILNLKRKHPSAYDKIERLNLSLSNYLGMRLNKMNEIILILLCFESNDQA